MAVEQALCFFRFRLVLGGAIALLTFSCPSMAHAYIGPGAGFAFLGSSFVFILTIVMALGTLLLWPLLWVLPVPRLLERLLARRVTAFQAQSSLLI